MCWSIGDGVADNFPDFEGAGLVEEEHGCCSRCSRSFACDVQASDRVGWNFGGKLVINPWWIVGMVSRYSRSASIQKLGLRSDGWMLVVKKTSRAYLQ